MKLVRILARPMLAAPFVTGGIEQLRRPDAHAERAEPVADLVSRSIPRVPKDTETLIRVNGAVQLGAGVLLALGRFPRLSALALAGTLVPATAGTHRFWEEDDAARRADQQEHLLKNAGLFGGLLFAAIAGRARRPKARRSRPKGSGGAKRASGHQR